LTIIVLERVTPGVRGRLTRWMLEVHPGVFLGTLSSRVREKLWHAVTGARRLGACTLIFARANEQGFVIETAGQTSRTLVDYDGLQLLRRSADSGSDGSPAP